MIILSGLWPKLRRFALVFVRAAQIFLCSHLWSKDGIVSGGKRSVSAVRYRCLRCHVVTVEYAE